MIRRSTPHPLRLVRLQAAIFRAVLACGMLVGVAVPPSVAAAEPTDASADVLLVIDGDPADLEPERLRDAIAREIRAPVALAIEAAPGRAALVLRMKPDRQVDLAYRDRQGRMIERAVDLPWESDRAIDTVALLAGNLVRDEAAEIAASLKKRQPPPSAAEPPPVPAAPSLPAAEPPPAPAAPSPPAAKPGPSAAPGRPKGLAKPPAPPRVLPSCASSRYPTVFAGLGYDPFGLVTGNLSFDHSVRHLSFNVTVGRSAGLRGFEYGMLGNYEHEFVCGVQIAHVGNVVTGPMRGVQAAAVFNGASTLDGVQIAGAVNVNVGAARGAQLGGGVNVSWGGPFQGVQASIVNIAAEMAGVQLGTLNIATGSVSGVQAGLVNYSRKEVRGVQIGLLNIADSSDFALGLFSFVRRGRHHIDVWGHETGLMAAGYKNGGKYFHYLYGAGGRPASDPKGGPVWGLGGHIPFARSLYADVDAIGYAFWSNRGEMMTLAELRLVFGLQLVRWFAIYAGPSYNVSIARDDTAVDFSLFGSHALTEPGSPPAVRGWPSAVVGVQLL